MNNHPANPLTKKSSRLPKAALLVVVLITLTAAGYLLLNRSSREPGTAIKNIVQDSVQKPGMLQGSTAAGREHTNEYAEYGEEEEGYAESYIIHPVSTGGRSFRFGDKVYVDNLHSNEREAVFYTYNPYVTAADKKISYTVSRAALIEGYRFEEYRRNFSLPPFTELDTRTKKLLLSENYSNGTSYSITQNAERAKTTISYGDFDADGYKDIAVIMDNNEKQSSRLLIVCTNVATREQYLAFSENYSDKIRINSFKKGAKILMNTESPVVAPLDGLILRGEDVKLAILYDTKLQKFKTYYQE